MSEQEAYNINLFQIFLLVTFTIPSEFVLKLSLELINRHLDKPQVGFR